jgi:hypothetical protein
MMEVMQEHESDVAAWQRKCDNDPTSAAAEKALQ